jgi:hypothetical protein
MRAATAEPTEAAEGSATLEASFHRVAAAVEPTASEAMVVLVAGVGSVVVAEPV